MRFLEKEQPLDGECYFWVRENLKSVQNSSDQVDTPVVLSLKTLENHLALGRDGSGQIRRVKWRHVSMDKASVYRYSLPVITTKFRLRLAHCLARNYRCCILCVWCLVILVISVGIVLSVVFGSA